MKATPYPRREFLHRLGTGALSVLALAGGAAVPMACGKDRDPLQGALVAFFDDPAGAEVVGVAYLEQAPDEASVDALLATLFQGAVAVARAQAESEPTSLYRDLRSRHEADLSAGRVAVVQEWVLSLTEARVCALVSLDGA